jgi:membrane protease YdiL (CAAX protease family)
MLISNLVSRGEIRRKDVDSEIQRRVQRVHENHRHVLPQTIKTSDTSFFQRKKGSGTLIGGETMQRGTERPRWFAWAPNIGLLTNLVINVLLPLWWITIYRKQPLSELGITTRRWLLALIIGIALAVFGSFRLREVAAGTDWPPHVLYNAVILWEPFFIFAWLQLRFDRAFGILPGIVLTGLCFTAYHIGTFPPASLVVLLISGLIYAAIFRLTRNLLSMWPLAWCVASSLGTLMGPYHFTWQQVAIWSVILVIQLFCIGYVWWKQKK